MNYDQWKSTDLDDTIREAECTVTAGLERMTELQAEMGRLDAAIDAIEAEQAAALSALVKDWQRQAEAAPGTTEGDAVCATLRACARELAKVLADGE